MGKPSKVERYDRDCSRILNEQGGVVALVIAMGGGRWMLTDLDAVNICKGKMFDSPKQAGLHWDENFRPADAPLAPPAPAAESPASVRIYGQDAQRDNHDTPALQHRILDLLDKGDETVTISREDLNQLYDAFSDSSDNMKYWKAAAFYLADIHAANGGETQNKSISNSAKSRLKSIMETSLSLLTIGYAKNFNVQTQESRMSFTIDRLKRLIESVPPDAPRTKKPEMKPG